MYLEILTQNDGTMLFFMYDSRVLGSWACRMQACMRLHGSLLMKDALADDVVRRGAQEHRLVVEGLFAV